MAKRSRSKHAGRYEPGEHFARLPVQVLESEAWAALPDWARTPVIGVAAQFRGSNNGDLCLTWRMAQSLGVSAEWKVRAGLKLAEKAGLLILVRPGGNVAGGQKLPNLYALGWESIEKSDKFAVPVADQLRPRNEWLTWQRPPDWELTVQAERHRAQGKKPHPTREEEAASLGRSDPGGERSPRVYPDKLNAATHGGDASGDLGGTAGIEAKARALMRQHPHLYDVDIARALRWRIDSHRVRALREAAP